MWFCITFFSLYFFSLLFLSYGNHCFLISLGVMADKPVFESKNGYEKSSRPPLVQKDNNGDVVFDIDNVVEWTEGGEEEEVENDLVALGLIGSIWMNRNPSPTTFYLHNERNMVYEKMA